MRLFESEVPEAPAGGGGWGGGGPFCSPFDRDGAVFVCSFFVSLPLDRSSVLTAAASRVLTSCTSAWSDSLENHGSDTSEVCCPL